MLRKKRINRKSFFRFFISGKDGIESNTNILVAQAGV